MSHYKTATALWNGQPERLPSGFTLTRSAGDYEHIAVCEAWTHPSGWELRLSIDGTSYQRRQSFGQPPRCASWSRRGRSRCWRRAGARLPRAARKYPRDEI